MKEPGLEQPQIVRLVNLDPMTLKNVQKIETEVSNLTKSMAGCRDDSMRAVLLCRRGALLRRVCVCACVCVHVHLYE